MNIFLPKILYLLYLEAMREMQKLYASLILIAIVYNRGIYTKKIFKYSEIDSYSRIDIKN